MKFAQKMRLAWIDAALSSGRMVRRSDISDAFEISTPQASLDLTAYREAHPELIRYDNRAKGYFRDGDGAAYDQSTLDAVQAAQEAVAALS